MSRFLLSPGAVADLQDIRRYLLSLPKFPALRLGRLLQQTLLDLAAQPHLGRIDEASTVLATVAIYRYVRGKYVFFYVAASPVEFLGILHGARDADGILRQRLG